MRIRILQPVTAVADLNPGDELIVEKPSASVQSLLAARRMDGSAVAEVIGEDNERADAPVTTPERAVGRRGQRAAAVS